MPKRPAPPPSPALAVCRRAGAHLCTEGCLDAGKAVWGLLAALSSAQQCTAQRNATPASPTWPGR